MVYISMQLAELHYIAAPSIDAPSIVKRAEDLIHSGLKFNITESSDAFLFSHSRHSVDYEDGAVPIQTAVLSAGKSSDPKAYSDHIQQSWSCNDAVERIERCTTSLLVSEMMARNSEPAVRIRLFHGVLHSLVEITRPHAIVFRHSQQIVSPETYLESCSKDPIYRTGALNVRFFTISNSDTDDMIMDTRGLDEIGLHDLQCHFHNLDPNQVSQVLFNSAYYLFEKGPIIESGQTLAGTDPESKWVCQFENSLLEPMRELLDLNPGPLFSAGSQQSS